MADYVLGVKAQDSMKLELPRAFKSACRNLGQDLVDAIREKPENEAIARLVNTALIGLDQSDAREIRRFIDDLLSLKPEPEALNEFWWSTPAEIHFHDGRYVQRFLQALSQRLGQSPYI